jgi:hypothetical protein
MTSERLPPPPDEQTGTGEPRSGAEAPALPEQAADYQEGDEVIADAARATSHPANATETNINRSGSGGTGGPGDDTDERYGSSDTSEPPL